MDAEERPERPEEMPTGAAVLAEDSLHDVEELPVLVEKVVGVKV